MVGRRSKSEESKGTIASGEVKLHAGFYRFLQKHPTDTTPFQLNVTLCCNFFNHLSKNFS